MATQRSNATSIVYYDLQRKNSLVIPANKLSAIDGLELERINSFSGDNKRLFISLKVKENPPVIAKGVKVDVWSYTDTMLQSQQLKEIRNKSCQAVIGLEDGKLFRLEYDNESLQAPTVFSETNE